MQQLDQVIPVPRLSKTTPEPVKQNNNNNIANALIAFHQTNPHAFEDRKNTHFHNSYASLESIYGLASPSDDDDGEVATITPPVAPHNASGVSTSGGNHSSKPPEVDLNSLIANAKTEKELTDLYVKHKPTDQNIINKFKTKKGELNGR